MIPSAPRAALPGALPALLAQMMRWSREASGSSDLDRVLKNIVRLIRSHGGVDRAGIFLFSPEAPENMHGTWGTDSKGRLKSLRRDNFVLNPRSPIARALASRTGIFYSPKIHADSRVPLAIRKSHALGVRDLAVIALGGRSKRLGALALDNALTGRPLGPELLGRVRALAEPAAAAIHNVQTVEALRSSSRNLLALNRLAQNLAEAGTFESVFGLICESAERLLDVKASGIFLVDPKTRELYVRYASGPGAESLKKIRLKIGEGVAGWVAKRRRAAAVDDVGRDSRFTRKADRQTRFRTRSLLAVPMTIGSRLVGVMEAVNRRSPRRFSPEDVELLQALARQASAAIEKAESREKVQETLQRLKQVDAWRQTAMKALVERETMFGLLLDHAHDGIHISRTGKAGERPWRRLVLGNEQFARMAGRELEDLRACKNLNEWVVQHEFRSRRLSGPEAHGAEILQQGLASWKRPDGAENFYEWRTIIVTLRGERYAIGIDRDITDQRKMKSAIDYGASHDLVTGLPNRGFFQGRIQAALDASRQEKSSLAVLALGLHRLRSIHEVLGFEVGDQVLKDVAGRLVEILGPDVSTARITTEHFGVLLERQRGPAAAAVVATRILEELAKPFRVEGKDLKVIPLLGISVYPEDGRDPALLLKQAVSAMPESGGEGRKGYRFFRGDMNTRVMAQMALENRIPKALEAGEFVLHYQPEVSCRTGALVGLEALARWNRPGTGLIPPAEFIPMMERTGDIVALGSWVLEDACLRQARWKKAGLPPCKIWINLSGLQFQDKGLAKQILGMLEKHGVDPALLGVEITESVAMGDPVQVAETLNQLGRHGVRSALDDFGTGFASLSHLTRLPVQQLKIDKSFVSLLGRGVRHDNIVDSIVSMAHKVGMEVVAEGVETKAQRDFLETVGCDSYQGYHRSRPLPVPELLRHLGWASPSRVKAP